MVQNRIGCTKKSSKDLGFDYELGLKDGLKELIAWRESNSAPGK
jgi:UDP-glucose 4-epimerase